MPNDFQDDEFHVELTDFDMHLPEVLEDLADIKIPFRIYSGVFHDASEKDETLVAIELEAMIDAAIWGAENSDWVKAFVDRRQARQDDSLDFGEDEYLGTMQ